MAGGMTSRSTYFGMSDGSSGSCARAALDPHKASAIAAIAPGFRTAALLVMFLPPQVLGAVAAHHDPDALHAPPTDRDGLDHGRSAKQCPRGAQREPSSLCVNDVRGVSQERRRMRAGNPGTPPSAPTSALLGAADEGRLAGANTS